MDLFLLYTVIIFILCRHCQHELLEYWNYLGAKGQEIERLYIKYGINRKIADVYVKDLECYERPNPTEKVIEYKSAARVKCILLVLQHKCFVMSLKA